MAVPWHGLWVAIISAALLHSSSLSVLAAPWHPFGMDSLPKVIPSIGYEVHMALQATSASSVCVLGCRQYGLVQTYIPRNMAVTLVCDDCTEQPNAELEGRLQGLRAAPPKVLCALPVDVNCETMVVDMHGDSKALSTTEVLGTLATQHKPKLVLVTDWYKRHLTVLSGIQTSLEVRQYSEGTSTSGSLARHIFSTIYRKQSWGPDGGASGPGSTLEVTANIQAALVDIVAKYNITSIVDAPCGSMHWMPVVLKRLPADVQYTGLDVACHLIQSHRRKFAPQLKWSFFCADVCHQHIPRADLVFSRDAMQHLPLDYTMDFLKQVKASGAKWLLIGSYIKTSINKNIKVGDYFLIDVTRPPFNVRPAPVEVVDEKTSDYKHMLLFDVGSMQWDTNLNGWQ